MLRRRAQGPRQRRIHGRGGGLGRALDDGVRPPDPRPDHVLVGRTELLDLRVTDAGGVERAADALGPTGSTV